MPFHLIVSGPRACFRRPEFKRDLITYDAITPCAARLILERVYKVHGLQWRLRSIDILNPIERAWETDKARDGDERRILTLRNVAYGIIADLAGGDGHDRSQDHADEIARRVLSMSDHRSFHLGLREFEADVAVASHDDAPRWTNAAIDLGWMPYDTGRGLGAPARFFHAVAVDGSIDLARLGPHSFAT